MKKQIGVRKSLPFGLAAVAASFALFLILFTTLAPPKTYAAAGINQQMAFEGKVVLANGTNITNGTYNMEFKIYNGGTNTGGGTLAWTEDYLVGGSGGVTLTNGTFEVNLGSITALSSVNFNSDTLWLSLQVGNSTSCTITTNFQSNCGGDGEMTPYIRLTAVPYAFNALELGGVAAANFGQLGSTQSWTAANTFSATGGNAIAATGAPTNVATSSLIQFGSAIASGNTTTNGGTYLGLNEPSSGAGSVADFLNFQNNGVSKLQVTSTGALTAASTLTVSSGGIAVTGNSTIAGTLTSVTGLTSSGTITFSGLNTAGVVHTNASGVLSTGPIVLGTDTSGSYVTSVGAGTGTTVGGTASVPTVNVTYGATSTSAVAGNTSLVCPSGSGGLSGGGNSITLGTGGTCTGLTLTSSPTFTGTITDSGTGNGLAITGTPTATATSSLAQIGNAIANGNTTTNGGTYLSINEPASGVGSVADLANFENNGTSELKLTSAGALTTAGALTIQSGGLTVTAGGITVTGASTITGTLGGLTGLTNSGTYDGNTFSSSQLQFSAASANTIYGTSGQSLTVASQGAGQLLLGSGSGTLGLTSTTATLQRVASGTTTLDLDDSANTLLLLENSGSGVANLDLYGGALQTGSSPVTRLDNAGDLTNIASITASGTFGLTGALTDTGTVIFQNGSSLALLTASTANANVQIGSATADATQVNLQLDSSNTYADAGTCSTTSNQGAMYYNTSTNAIRACINGAWEDLVSTAGLGILAFGVVADTGTVPGDISSHSSTTVGAGPCKVTWASITSVTVTACSAYTGGRKVVYAGGTITGISDTSGNWTHICFANATTPFAATNTLNALTATATETANLPQWNSGNPVVCVADVKGTGTTINIYDTRVFTNTLKTFVNTYVAMGLGWIAKDNASVGNGTVTQPGTTAGAGYLKGVIVASAGTACTTACGPNAVMAYGGPVYIKSIAGTLGTTSFVENSATNSYAGIGTGSTALTPYESLGIAETPFVSTCTSAVNCNLSMLVDLDIR